MLLYYILILSLPMIDDPVFGRQIGGLTVEKIVGLACIAYAIFELLAKRRVPQFLATPQACAFIVFYLLTLLAFVDAPATSKDMMQVYTGHLAFMFVTLALVKSVERLRWTLLFVIAAIDWASLYMIRDWQTGSAIYGFDYRPGYVTGDANYFTASAILCLPMILYLWSAVRRSQTGDASHQKRRWIELIYYAGSFCLIVIATILGASRGGLIGIVAFVAFMAWRSKRRVRNLIVIACLGAIPIFATHSGPIQRLLHPTVSDKQSSDIRILLWQAGLNMVKSHPLIGIGLGRFKAVSLMYAPAGYSIKHIAHNTYLEMAAEIGIPGLLAFLATLLFTFYSAGRIRTQATERGVEIVSVAASSIQAGLIGFLVSIFFISAEFLKLLWFVIFLSSALPYILWAQEQKARLQPARLNKRRTHRLKRGRRRLVHRS